MTANSSKNKPAKCYKVPMWYMWSLIGEDLRKVLCRFSFPVDDTTKTDEDLHFIATLEWVDIPREYHVAIKRFLDQSENAKWDMLMDESRKRYVPILSAGPPEAQHV